MKIRFSSHVVLDLRCIQRAEIRPECSILVLFGSWWGYLVVAMCFPMFPDQFRVIKVVRFEFLQKRSFLGLRTIEIWPYLGFPQCINQLMRNPSDAMTLTFYCQSSRSDLSEPGVCPTYLTYGDFTFCTSLLVL